MKKNKNETAKGTVIEETKGTVKNPPARGKESGENETLFKKVLYGYDPDEVTYYINELNHTYQTESRMHESKLSSLKEELVLSNRERNLYIEKYKESQAKLDSLENPDTVADSKEYENIIAELRARCELLENENASLQSAQSNTSEKDYTEKIRSLEAENADLEATVEASKRESAELMSKIQKNESIVEEYKTVFAQLETAKAMLISNEKSIAEKKKLLEKQADEIRTLQAETEKIKKQSAELEIKNSVLSQRISESEDEIIRLKDENKIKAFEHAEKINSLETEHAKDKLAMQKELKLYGYYVDRAELTLGELNKQIEQLKQSIDSAQEK